MTTKQIAEAVGKAEKTVRTWAAKAAAKSAVMAAKLAASTSTHPADYDLDETVAIIEVGLGKNAAALYRENARKAPDIARMDRLEGMILELTKAVAGLIPAIAVARGSQVPALPAPVLAPRAELRRIMTAAGKASGDYSGAWGQLYQEIYYRMHRNVNECAKNRGMEKLDYIEVEGMLPEVVAIAREVFGGDD